MLRLTGLMIRNVWRARRRSLLTLASTAVSLALLTMLIALFQGIFYGDDESPSQALRLVCRHRVSLTQSLPASHQQRIRAIPGVKKVSAWTWFGGKYKEPQDFFGRFAVDADIIFDERGDWNCPHDQLAVFKRDRVGCAIGEKLAKQYNMKLGDHVIITGDIYDVTLDLTLDAIYAHLPNTECLIFHREYLTELLPATSSQRDTVGTYLVLADKPENVPRIAKAIDALFANSPYPTRTESEKEFGRSFLAFLGNVKMFLLAVCGAVTFTILLVSANTIAMSVRERTKELAILRTLGFTPSEILQLVLGESTMLSVLGGFVGLTIGFSLVKGLQASGIPFPFPSVKWQAAAIVLWMAMFIGVLAALVPAVLASRRNIVESLRFSG